VPDAKKHTIIALNHEASVLVLLVVLCFICVCSMFRSALGSQLIIRFW